MLTITKSRENVLDSINLHLKIYSVDHQLKAEPMLLLKSDFLIRKTLRKDKINLMKFIRPIQEWP